MHHVVSNKFEGGTELAAQHSQVAFQEMVSVSQIDDEFVGKRIAPGIAFNRVFDSAFNADTGLAHRTPSRNAYRPLSFTPNIEIGEYGPFYEIRTYEIAAGGLPETEAAWAKVVAQRQKISRLLMVMASVESAPQQMVHLWPYKTLNDRTAARAEASKTGIWPPPGSSTHLLSLKSELFVATKFSPLT